MPEYAAAAVAGVFAAQVMELPAYTQRALGLPVRQDIFVETGAILRAPERFRSLVGWLGHACTAAFIAMGYAGFFAAVSAQPPNLWWGLLAGTIHFAAGAMVIAAYPLVHPDVPKRLPSPGFSYRRWGRRDVITFLLGHLLYGALVAALYRSHGQRRSGPGLSGRIPRSSRISAAPRTQQQTMSSCDGEV